MNRFKMDEKWMDMPQGVATFGGLVGWVCEDLKSRERILLGMLHGDSTVTQQEADSWIERPLQEFDTLEFLSSEPRELAFRTCEDLISLTVRLNQRGEEAAQALDAGKKDRAAAAFAECLDGWGMVLQGYWNLVQVAQVDPAVVEIGGRSISDVLSDLSALTGRMAGGFVNDDMEGLKALVTQDLVLFVNPMREAFEHVQVKLEEVTA